MAKIILGFSIIILGIIFFVTHRSYDLPKGETVRMEESEDKEMHIEEHQVGMAQVETKEEDVHVSNRDIFITDGTKHSIPLEEILSGGVGKDGIPSIDDPKFITTKSADEFLENDAIGLGLVWKGEARFYPFQILVFHELVNDVIEGDPVLVSYCPLCATAIVFDPRVNDEVVFDFGVSGLLWQSNLLMYNRTEDPEDESLWSQVLGEAVLGPLTGTKLKILPADTVRYNDWKEEYPETKVLSRDTGESRRYGTDPYGNYYTNDTVGFGATFRDDRLHPKAFVLGIEINGEYKAYADDSLKIGTTKDSFVGKAVSIEKNKAGEIRIFDESRNPIPYIGGFWFSWLAVHPGTELFK